MKGLSIIVCCYNSGDKLIPTLAYLAKQQRLAGVGYELLIVDNNCTDNSINAAKIKWEQYDAPFPQRVISASIPGLSYAREAGIINAAYPYVVLCDDDNWLSEDYVAKVFSLFEKIPEVALIGGVGEAVSDIELPQWFKTIDGFGYAVGSEGRSTGYVESIYGAGMALRKDVFNSVIRDVPLILCDRKKKSLSSGGDTEICMRLRKAGYKIYLDEDLTFKHFLTSNRLKWKYYLQLRKAFGRANALLEINYGGVTNKNNFFTFLSIVKYALLHSKYFLFSLLYKEEGCASYVQEINRRLLLLTAGTK